jgi:hypothetical protein
MDSYDEIFEFLNVPSDKRIACLKHLLTSAQAKLTLNAREEISKTVNCEPEVVDESSSEAYSDSESSPNLKFKKCIIDNTFASIRAEEEANAYNVTSEQILNCRFGTGWGKIKINEVRKYIDSMY